MLDLSQNSNVDKNTQLKNGVIEAKKGIVNG